MAMLGISTNTRLLGLAIINRKGLVEYSIRLHKSPWSPSKANEIITSLEPCVRQYCIKSVILSIPHAYHQTEAFKELISVIRLYFEKKNIPVHTQTIKTLFALCPPGQKKTKRVLMKTLIGKFPQLTYFYHKEMRNKNKYYIKLFEAVGIVALYLRMQKEKR